MAVLDWKKKYMVPTRIKIPTVWLRDKLKLERIPAARPLNNDHVKTLAHSFSMTSTMSASMTLCFWGVSATHVEQQLLLASSPEGPPLGVDILNHWYGLSKEMGPIEGQHSFAAVMQLNEKYPKKTVWQSVEPTIIICEGNPNDVHMVHAMGQQSNFKVPETWYRGSRARAPPFVQVPGGVPQGDGGSERGRQQPEAQMGALQRHPRERHWIVLEPGEAHGSCVGHG